jgi:hypothetical protein
VSFFAQERAVESLSLRRGEAGAYLVVCRTDQICERSVREARFRLRRACTEYAQAPLTRARKCRAPNRGLADAGVSLEQENDARSLGRVKESLDGSELNLTTEQRARHSPSSFGVSILRRPLSATLSAPT